MWRSFFVSLSIMLIVVGVECLFIDSATFGPAKVETVQVNNGWFNSPTIKQKLKGGKTIKPPDWAPWSFIFSGTVVMLYSFTLPNRWKSGD